MSLYFKPDYNRTFKAWSMDGYKIRKGSKAVGKTERGEYLFSPRQVTKREKPLYLSGSHWESSDDDYDCGGPRYGIYGNCD